MDYYLLEMEGGSTLIFARLSIQAIGSVPPLPRPEMVIKPVSHFAGKDPEYFSSGPLTLEKGFLTHELKVVRNREGEA